MSESGRSSASGASGGSAGSGEEARMRGYVEEFRREVEAKFAASRVNQTYRFPRKPRASGRGHSRRDSFDSLNNVTYYDLDSQNVKSRLSRRCKDPDESVTEILVDVVRHLGRLDPRYLASQFQNPRSPFFRMLQRSISVKYEKDRQSIDTVKASTPRPGRRPPAEPRAAADAHVLLAAFRPTSQLRRAPRPPASPFSLNSSHQSCGARPAKPLPDRARHEASGVAAKQPAKPPALFSAVKSNITKSHTDLHREVVRSTPRNAAPSEPKAGGMRRKLEQIIAPELRRNPARQRAETPKNKLAGHCPLMSTLDPCKRKETFKKFIISHKK